METYVDYFRCGEIYKSPSHSNKTPYILKCYQCSDIFLLLESFIFHIEDYCKPFKEEKDVITPNLFEPPQEIQINRDVDDAVIVVKNEPVLDDIDYEENMVVEDSGGGDLNNCTKFSQDLDDGKDDQMPDGGSSNDDVDEGNDDLVEVFEIDHLSDSEDDTFANKNSIVPNSENDTDNPSEEINIESETVKEIEESCVNKCAYKKQKTIPKRLQDMTNRDTSVQPNPCINKKCQNSCGSKVSESDRILINEHFWGIGNKIRQKDWLRSCIKRKSVNRRRSDSYKKKYTYDCIINYNDTSLKVCQQFLLKTLHISQQMLITVRDNSKYFKSCSTTKKRSAPHNKTDESKVAIVKAFIEQLPAVPLHYCRHKSNKLYLPQEFRNIKGLYECYIEHLRSLMLLKSAQLSLRVFRNIFKNCFQIGFHLPKKDKCITCENYNNLNSEAQTILESTEDYQNHMRQIKSEVIFL